MGNKFSSYSFSDSQKSLLCKGLRFTLPPKNIDYAGFLVQFEVFIVICCSLPFEKRDFLKNKLKDVCFSTLISYNSDKVNTNLTKSECRYLKTNTG